MALPKLTAPLGPGFTISLKQGVKRTPVRTLKAGTYTFVIADKASIHNFLIEGPGVERDDHDCPLRRDEDRDHQAEEGHVQVLLPAARKLDVRLRHA